MSTDTGTAPRPAPSHSAEPTAELVTRLRDTFRAGRTRSLEWRLRQLRQLRAMITENGPALAGALHADLHKNETEAYAAEIDFPVREIDHTLENLEEWLRPRAVTSGTLALFPAGASAGIQYDPLGTVLVVAPWNYPVQLLLVPVAGALAAGNNVVAKPSEVAPATSELLARLLRQYLDDDAVGVVEGGVPETTELLEQHFDHIFYTGNGTVGRIVMRAAAEHLTPVTLELGGKSPAFVDRGADLGTTAERLVRAKFQNAGQTCVAPDYVLTDPETARSLEGLLAEAVEKVYGTDPAASPAYGRLINERHFDRVAALLDSGRTVVGGELDRAGKYIAPTVLAGVTAASPVMQEEIFGPVLPVVEVADLDEAIGFINDRDKPLALYAFTGDDGTRARLAAETSSGGLGFGLPMAHLRIPELPFGGVGESGMGAYHGLRSIETFSHSKSVLDVPLG